MKRENLWVVIVNSILGAAMIITLALCLNKLEWYLQTIAYVCVAAFTVGCLVAFLFGKKELTRSFFFFNIVAFIIIAMLAVLNLCGIFESLDDAEKLKEWILASGSWGIVIFALFTVLNVVILPIPAAMLILVGVAVFEPWITFAVASVSTIIGSMIAFFIGRVFGKKAVVWCVGEENTKKYTEMIGSKGNLLFILMQLLPFFPDDVLCMIAGLSSMKLSFFTVSIIIVRPIYIAVVCFFGSGDLIPFSGWGIPVWIAIFVVLGVLFILFCKYQTRIENWMQRVFKIKKKNAEAGEVENTDNCDAATSGEALQNSPTDDKVCDNKSYETLNGQSPQTEIKKEESDNK